jgi:hypothetical protein
MKQTIALLMNIAIIGLMVIAPAGCADNSETAGGSMTESNIPTGTTSTTGTTGTTTITVTEETSSREDYTDLQQTEESELPSYAAAVVIDPFIDQAIAAMEGIKRNDLSDITYPYERPVVNLDIADKAMYDEMLAKVKAFEPFVITAKEHGYDEMDRSLRVFGAIARNYPEIENYFCMREVDDEEGMTIATKAHYFLPGDADMAEADITQLRQETDLFDAVCDRIVERMPEDLSAYDKYYYLAAVISLVTSYDYEGTYGWQDGTAYGAVIGGHSICEGYATGFMVLCRKANLWCEYADGESAGNAHVWNLVKLDTGTYHIDITWADEKGLPGSAEWERYFMLTQEEILTDHEVYDGITATGTLIN